MTETASVLQVTREAAANLMVALDFKTAGNWPATRLQKTICDIKDIIDDDTDISDEATQATLVLVVDAIDKEMTIEVVDEVEAELPTTNEASEAPKKKGRRRRGQDKPTEAAPEAAAGDEAGDGDEDAQAVDEAPEGDEDDAEGEAESDEGTNSKPVVEKAKKAKVPRAKIMGRSPTSIFLWMGSQGFDKDGIRKVADHFVKDKISDITVRWAVAAGKRAKHAKQLAELSADEQAEIINIAGPKPEPKPPKPPKAAKVVDDAPVETVEAVNQDETQCEETQSEAEAETKPEAEE